MTLLLRKNSLLILAILVTITVSGNNIPDSIKVKLEYLSGSEKLKYLNNQVWKLREKDPLLAIEYGEFAVHLTDSLDILSEAAKTYNYIGVIYLHYLYDTQKALPYLHRGLEFALQNNDSTEIAYTFNNLGDVFFLTGNSPLALKYAERSLGFFEKLNDSRGKAYTYINLGLVYREENQFDAALEYFFKSIEMRKKISAKVGIASALLEIGRTYFAGGEYDSALTHFRKSFELNQSIGNKRYTAFSLNGIADVYYEKGRYSEALEKYNQSLKLDIERNHYYGIVSNKLGKALVYSKTGRKKEGEVELNEAIRIAEDMGLPPKIKEAYEASTRFYLNVNDYKTATDNFKDFLFVYDSLFSRQQFETFSEIENRYQISQKLKQTNRELEIKTHEEQYLVVIIVLMTILVAVLVWRYRANKLLNERLKASNDSKDKLFAIISHDLKNPFNALIGFVDLLKDETLSEKERKEYIVNLDSVTHSTYKLLENLLNLSASRAGKLDFNPGPFELPELVSQIIESQSMLTNNKRISIETDLPKENFTGDKQMIEIVIRNLISNAIKFSRPDSLINIRSFGVNGYNVIVVKDCGIGMNKETKEKLFTSDFIQSTTGTGGERGTGIGLSLCYEIVKKHNGKIEVNSESDKGSEFLIYLPADKS